MRKMKKVKRKHTRIISLCLLVVAVILITSCADSSRNHSTDTNETMNIAFGENGMIRNGTEYKTYQVEEGQKGIISVRISKLSGRLDIDIYQVGNEDKPNYTGRDLDSASFDVIAGEPGEYKVRLTATEFVGEYEINLRTEDSSDK